MKAFVEFNLIVIYETIKAFVEFDLIINCDTNNAFVFRCIDKNKQY